MRTLSLVAMLCGVGCAAPGKPVDIAFEARVGADKAVCGQSYEAVGSTSSTIELQDLRAYVSALTIDGAGEIDNEDVWQAQSTALLDFEDKTGKCTGNTDTRTVVHAHAPTDSGTIEFDIGVPEDLNHLDPSKLASPLNVSSMFWGWTAGFRFLKLDLATTGQPEGWLAHVGSSGCAGVTGGDAACANANRIHVKLEGWSTDSTIVIDLGALLASADVDTNTADTGPGCMSEPDDPDCAPVFAALGLPFGDTDATTQSVFSVE